MCRGLYLIRMADFRQKLFRTAFDKDFYKIVPKIIFDYQKVAHADIRGLPLHTNKKENSIKITLNVMSLKRQRGRTTNGEIGPVANGVNEVWNCTIFC